MESTEHQGMKIFLRNSFWARCVVTFLLVIGVPIWLPAVLVYLVFVGACDSLMKLLEE